MIKSILFHLLVLSLLEPQTIQEQKPYYGDRILEYVG
jgi:hypothetical protein